MPTVKRKAFVVVFVCLFLASIWFTIPFEKRVYDSDAAAPEATLTRDEQVVAAFKRLKSVHAGGWLEAAFKVGAYGDPDEATEAIIELIQNRDDVTVQNSKLLEGWSESRIAGLRSGAYRHRLQVLRHLGLTGTKRAEELLLDAYKNPRNVIPNSKYAQLADGPLGDATYADDKYIDGFTRRNALIGLMVLDEAKYSPMLEEEFKSVLTDVERIYKNGYPPKTVEDIDLRAKFGIYLDVLVYRDLIRERGIENPEYLLGRDAFLGVWKTYSSRYWNHETKTAVPRQ